MKTPRNFWLASALLVAALAGCQNAVPPAPPAPPKLGMQAYTFRRFTFAETLDKLQALDIHYLQAFPNQDLGGGLPGKFNYPMDEATRTAVLALIKSKGVEVVSYGVITGKTEEEWHKIFEFAKSMGLQNITSEPPQDAMPLVDRLSREFGITVALHNHPTPNRYANPATSLAAIKPYGANIGLCADTGHWVRSGFDAVDSLRRAEGRILYLHFKDLNERGVRAAHDVPWGTGVSNAAGQIAELRRQGFSGIVFMEYEHDTPTLESDVARSAAYFRLAVAASQADLIANRVVPPQFTRDPAQLWSGDRGKDSPRWPSPQALQQSDLADGEMPAGAWNWQDGTLSAAEGGTLWTKEGAGDFSLMAELRSTVKSDGSIYLRARNVTAGRAGAKKAAPAPAADSPPAATDTQAPTAVSPPKSDDKSKEKPARKAPLGQFDASGKFLLLAYDQLLTDQPGEWTQLVMIARDGTLTVTLDHKEIAKVSLDNSPKSRSVSGKSAKKAPSSSKSTLVGPIGLQFQGGPIELRNLFIERP